MPTSPPKAWFIISQVIEAQGEDASLIQAANPATIGSTYDCMHLPL